MLWHKQNAPDNKFLFPARHPSFEGRRRVWLPHASNGISAASFTRLARLALREVCGLCNGDALKYSIHDLRVGGINFYRRHGVSVSLRAQMADHKSIETSRRYLRLLPHEEFASLRSAVNPLAPQLTRSYHNCFFDLNFILFSFFFFSFRFTSRHI